MFFLDLKKTKKKKRLMFFRIFFWKKQQQKNTIFKIFLGFLYFFQKSF